MPKLTDRGVRVGFHLNDVVGLSHKDDDIALLNFSPPLVGGLRLCHALIMPFDN